MFNKCTIYFIFWDAAQSNFLGIFCSVLIISLILFLTFKNKHKCLFEVYSFLIQTTALAYIFPHCPFLEKQPTNHKEHVFKM